MRIGGLILSVVGLLWGFLQAPFDHIHPDDLDHPAISGLVHLHGHTTLTGHGPFIVPRTDDDDEIDILWSVTMSTHVVLHADIELAERVFVPDPSFASAAVLIPWHRGHDPPESSPKVSRAPPA